MPTRVRSLTAAPLVATVLFLSAACTPEPRPAVTVEVNFFKEVSSEALDGRLILILSQIEEGGPRTHVSDGPGAQPVFGIDVEEWAPGETATFADTVFGFPIARLGDLPAGRYRAQALLNRYQTFTRSDGHTVKLPPDRGEGQQWARKPGNLYSAVSDFVIGGSGTMNHLSLTLDQVIDELPDPETLETEWVKFIRIRSELLSDFWGTDTYLGAWVMLPDGFDEHPDARYPVAIFHGHFPSSFTAMRVEPPDTTEPCVYSARFSLDCYNRVQQEIQHELYREWTSRDFPRHLVVQIQHATPYYDDSYAVNSENNGPYGDAIMQELIPAVEKEFRGIGEGWARFTYGGSTGGWEAMAVQVLYPDDFNGAYAAAYWRENYDLTYIMRRDWKTLGPKLEGKLHIYVGEMDNYYLNNAVYLAEEFLEGTTDPYYGGEFAYGARDEHCWNGDPNQPNAISRLRYIQMFAPRMVERMMANHPPGADLTSWRY